MIAPAVPQGGFSGIASAAMVVIGIVGSMMATMQSTLLPQLVDEKRLTLPQLGEVATAESIGVLIAVTGANVIFRHERLKLVILGIAALAVTCNLATPHFSGSEIIALRFVHGLCVGMFLWVWVGFITRSANPARWMGIFMTAQAATIMVLSTVLAGVLMPWGGSLAAYCTIAAIYGAAALTALVVPSNLRPLEEAGGSVMPPLMGWIGLAAVFAQIAAILAMWVYIKPYGKEIGLDETVTGTAVSLATAAQVVGGLVVVAVAGRVRSAQSILFLVSASIASLAVLALVETPVAFIAATVAFAFFWKMGPPFYIPYLIEIDPTRRAAIHMNTVASLGASAGPALASLWVGKDDVMPVLVVSAVLYAIGGGIVAATGLRRRGAATASA